MGKSERKCDKSGYYAEDCRCSHYQHNYGKKCDCSQKVCRCADIRADVIVNGRIKRNRGRSR